MSVCIDMKNIVISAWHYIESINEGGVLCLHTEHNQTIQVHDRTPQRFLEIVVDGVTYAERFTHIEALLSGIGHLFLPYIDKVSIDVRLKNEKTELGIKRTAKHSGKEYSMNKRAKIEM